MPRQHTLSLPLHPAPPLPPRGTPMRWETRPTNFTLSPTAKKFHVSNVKEAPPPSHAAPSTSPVPSGAIPWGRFKRCQQRTKCRNRAGKGRNETSRHGRLIKGAGDKLREETGAAVTLNGVCRATHDQPQTDQVSNCNHGRHYAKHRNARPAHVLRPHLPGTYRKPLTSLRFVTTFVYSISNDQTVRGHYGFTPAIPAFNFDRAKNYRRH